MLASPLDAKPTQLSNTLQHCFVFYLIDFQKITARLFSLFGYDFISVDTQSKLKIHDIPTTHKTIYEGLIYKSVLGRVFIVIQRRIENPVKHLRWCFLQK